MFSDSALERLNNIFEDLVRRNPDKRTDELDTPHFKNEKLFDFLLDKKVLDLVEDLIGQDIGIWSSHFISKEPGSGRRTPWHEDGAYWKGKFDRMDKIVTIWLALDDSDIENGCMGVIPGSHKNEYSSYHLLDDLNHNTFKEEIDDSGLDLSKVIWFELKKGQCSLHDSRIIHGAKANTSSRRRCGYTMRYFSLGMKFKQSAAPGHRIWYARGENKAGNPLEYF